MQTTVPAEDSQGFGVVDGTLTSHLHWTIEPDHGHAHVDGFTHSHDLGDLKLATTRMGPGRFRRGARELALSKHEYVAFVFVGAGSELVGQGARLERVPVRGMLAWDSVRSAECVIPQQVSKHVLFVPRHRFTRVVPRPELITMRPIPQSPATRLLWSMFAQIGAGPRLSAATAAAVGSATLELTRAACEQGIPVPESWEDSAILTLARRYIDEQLADPRLDPARIARALGISRRTLYRVFAPSDEPVSAYIRRLRMDRAYREIAHWPAVRQVAEIARSVGFTDPGHFTRSFRAAFGESPSEVRRRLFPADATTTD